MPEPKNIQLDMICLQCPIESGCDEASLFCAFRWSTDPNEAQRGILEQGALPLLPPRPIQITRLPSPLKMKIKVTVKMLRRKRGPADRTQYWHDRHLRKKQEKAGNENVA